MLPICLRTYAECLVDPPNKLLATKSQGLQDLKRKPYYSPAQWRGIQNHLTGRVSRPKAAPELRLFRAPFPEARGERKEERKKERTTSRLICALSFSRYKCISGSRTTTKGGEETGPNAPKNSRLATRQRTFEFVAHSVEPKL